MAKKKKKKGDKKRKKDRARKRRKKSKRYSSKGVAGPGLREDRGSEGPPPGFISVTLSHGMMAYGQPLMALAEVDMDDPEGINRVMELAMHTWNLPLAPEKVDRKGWVKQAMSVLSLSKEECESVFERMVERREEHFPPDIQPGVEGLVYMKKEEGVKIEPFDYDRLEVNLDEVSIEEEDHRLVEELEELDWHIFEEIDYSRWEMKFLEVKDLCLARFDRWMEEIELGEVAVDFARNVGIFFDFVYLYQEERPRTLDDIEGRDLNVFLTAFLVHKVLTDPRKYPAWPPAIKYFYTFLGEVGYSVEHEKVIGLLEVIEPKYLEFLQERYG